MTVQSKPKTPAKKVRPILPIKAINSALDPVLSRFRQMLPVQRTWADYDVVSADELNGNVRDAVNFLLSPPRVHLQMVNNNMAIPLINNGAQPIAFDTLLRDTDNMWDSNFASRINFNTPGLYKWRLYYHTTAQATAGCVHAALARISNGIFPIAAVTGGYANPKLVEDTRQYVQTTVAGTTCYIEGFYSTSAQDDYLEAFCSCSKFSSSSTPTIQSGFFQARMVDQQ